MGFVGRDIHFRTAQGAVLVTGPDVPKAAGIQGQPVKHTLDVLVPGNIVDVTVALADRPRAANQIQDIHLVRGKVQYVEFDVPAVGKAQGRGGMKAGAGGASYKGAVITKVGPFKVTLDVKGETVVIGRTDFNAHAVDLKGNALRPVQKQRLLKVGNTVDVELRPKRDPDDPDEAPMIRSIRLIKGELTGPGG